MHRAAVLLMVFFLAVSTLAFYTALTLPPVRSTVATGISMYPELQSGDIIYGSRPRLPSDIHVGDIVVFWWGDTLIVHRVVDIQEPFEGGAVGGVVYVTQGDYNSEYYPRRAEIGFYDIVFVVEDVVRPGTAEYYWKENAWFLAILSLVATVFSALVSLKFSRED